LCGVNSGNLRARDNLNPFVIEGDQPGGQLIRTTHVEKLPELPESINDFDLVNSMRIQTEKMGPVFGLA
jgi:thioredoxin reductase (NADPH)